MKLTPTIYNQYKTIANYGYNEMYEQIAQNIPNYVDLTTNEDKILAREQQSLTVDIMLSNILGYITSFDEVHEYIKNKEMYENLAHENKCMAEALQRLNYTPEQISDICNGAI